MEQLHVAEDHPADQQIDHHADAGIQSVKRIHSRLWYADAGRIDLYDSDCDHFLLLPEELYRRNHRRSQIKNIQADRNFISA